MAILPSGVAAALYNGKGVLKILHRGGGAILFDEPVRVDALRGEPVIHTVGLGHALAIALPAAEDGGTAGLASRYFIAPFHAVDERERRPVIQHGGTKGTTMYFFSPAFLSERALPMISPSTAQKYMSPTVVTITAAFHSASGAKAAERDERRRVDKREGDISIAAHGELEEQREDEENGYRQAASAASV